MVEAWPNRSWTTFGCTPCLGNKLACVAEVVQPDLWKPHAAGDSFEGMAECVRQRRISVAQAITRVSSLDSMPHSANSAGWCSWRDRNSNVVVSPSKSICALREVFGSSKMTRPP